MLEKVEKTILRAHFFRGTDQLEKNCIICSSYGCLFDLFLIFSAFQTHSYNPSGPQKALTTKGDVVPLLI